MATSHLTTAVVLLSMLAASALAQTGPKDNLPRAGDRMFLEGDRQPPEAPEGVRCLRDIPYARVTTGKGAGQLHMDLYLPAGAGGKLPVIVWVHGGGWRNGNKNRFHLPWITTRGFALASINYRLSDEAVFPAQIHDCKGAVRWLRANADKYGLDGDHIGVAGSSAGGHLAALMGTSGGVKELEGDTGGNLDQSSRVQCVVDYFGTTDFLAHYRSKKRKETGATRPVGSALEGLFGGSPEDKPELVRLANPTTHISKDDPLFMIFHGDRDPVVPMEQSVTFHKALKGAGVEATLVIIKGGNHGGPLAKFYGLTRGGTAADVRKARDRLVGFFSRHLRPASAG